MSRIVCYPVTDWMIATAETAGLPFARTIADISARALVPFHVGCALTEQESGGLNVYGGHDASPFAGFPEGVNQGNFKLFYWLVTERGMVPTGVGPAQITYAGELRGGRRDGGYFKQMLDKGMRPWDFQDNLLFGLAHILRPYRVQHGSWYEAGARYNGGPSSPNYVYGAEFRDKVQTWKHFLGR